MILESTIRLLWLLQGKDRFIWGPSGWNGMVASKLGQYSEARRIQQALHDARTVFLVLEAESI